MFSLLYHSYMELYYSNPVFVRLCHTSFSSFFATATYVFVVTCAHMASAGPFFPWVVGIHLVNPFPNMPRLGVINTNTAYPFSFFVLDLQPANSHLSPILSLKTQRRHQCARG